MSDSSKNGSVSGMDNNYINTGQFIRNPGTITGRLHDEIVMMDIDQGKYFSLNPVATSIWDLLEKPMSIDALCELLIEEYEVDPVQCREEVNDHIREMSRLGLIIKNQPK